MLKYLTGKTLSKIHKLCENIEFIAEYFCCRSFGYTLVCFSMFIFFFFLQYYLFCFGSLYSMQNTEGKELKFSPNHTNQFAIVLIVRMRMEMFLLQ